MTAVPPIPGVNYRSFHAMLKAVETAAPRFRGFDAIVGVPRSGVIPAVCLAMNLGVPFATIEAVCSDLPPHVGLRPGTTFQGWDKSRILVVDDSVNNGIEMQRVKSLFERLSLNCTYLAIYASSNGTRHIDEYLELLEYPRLFEWNVLDHPLGEKACFDLDGVLCQDPLQSDKVDDEAYRRFISTASRLHVPHHKIGWIVTSRLERYRAETEAWLSANRIQYGELIMMRNVDADTRQRFLLHGLFKADIMRQLPAWYFVESSLNQAKVITRISGRPCFSVEGMSMCFPSERGEEGEVVDRLTYAQALASSGSNSKIEEIRFGARLMNWLRGPR